MELFKTAAQSSIFENEECSFLLEQQYRRKRNISFYKLGMTFRPRVNAQNRSKTEVSENKSCGYTTQG